MQVGVWHKLFGGHQVFVLCLGPALDLEGGVAPQSILVYITVEDRLPGDQVCVNFTAELEVLERFLGILEQDGLKFTRNVFIPNFLILCRVDKDKGGLTVIGENGRHDPDNGPKD